MCGSFVTSYNLPSINLYKLNIHLIDYWMIWHVGCLKCTDKIIWVENVIPDQKFETNSTVTSYVRYTLLLCMDSFQALELKYMLLGGIKYPRWDMQVLTRISGGMHNSHLKSQLGRISTAQDPGWDIEIPPKIPGGMQKSHIWCGIPGGIEFSSQMGKAGSHYQRRDPTIPTWDPMWDWRHPT